MSDVTSKRRDHGFSPLLMIALVAVGVVTLLGVAVLSAYSPELKSGDDGGAHALSRSSVGYAGIVKLLRLSGAPVMLSRRVLDENASESLLVMTPQPNNTADQLSDRDHMGALLIVLPKWHVAPSPRRAGWVNTLGPVEPLQKLLDLLPDDMGAGATLSQRDGSASVVFRRPQGQAMAGAVEVENLRTIKGPGWIPVIVDDRGEAVLAMYEDSWIYVLADPDLIATHGLKTPAGADLAMSTMNIVRADDVPVVFDLTLNGFQRTRSLWRLVFEPPLLGATLIVLALGVLGGMQAAIRFGPARTTGRAVPRGKQALADNTAGLVRLARREYAMAVPYSHLVRSAVVRAIGVPRRLQGEELDAFLDRVGARGGARDRYTVLAARASEAKTVSDLMQVARDLHRWKQEIVRGRQ